MKRGSAYLAKSSKIPYTIQERPAAPLVEACGEGRQSVQLSRRDAAIGGLVVRGCDVRLRGFCSW